MIKNINEIFFENVEKEEDMRVNLVYYSSFFYCKFG